MKQGVYDKSTAGGENTGEIQFAVFYLAEKGAQSVKSVMGLAILWTVVNPGVLRLQNLKRHFRRPTSRSPELCPSSGPERLISG